MPNNNITSYHDRYFRLMMSDPKVIREFFEQYLPSNIKNIINFDTIQPQKDSFIGDSLKLQIADLLFSAEFDGKLGYIYLLIEHQSTPDKLMAFRMVKYMIAIMEQHIKKTKIPELPIVYPLLFYSGWRDYKHSTDIFDLFGDNKELARDILWKPCQLIDISKISDEKLKENLLYGIFARIMKHAHEKNTATFVSFLKNIIKDLKHAKNISGIEYIYGTLSYIIEAFDIPEEKFTEIVRENLPFIDEEKIMTIAEQYRQKGIKEGLEKGMEAGMEAGMEVGIEKKSKSVAIKLFNQGMSVSQIAAITDLSTDEVEALKNYSSN